MSTNNVTVNGEPLKEFLDREATAEISEVRERDKSVKILRRGANKAIRNHSSGRSSVGVTVWRVGQRETHVVVAGQLFSWTEKAPFETSGFSIMGGLEYDAASEDLKCHDCGEWFASLSSHIHKSRSHGSVREYKVRHGIRLSSSLEIPRLRATRSIKSPLNKRDYPGARPRFSPIRQRGIGVSMERRNLLGLCRAQRLDALKELAAKLGRTPSTKELREHRCLHPAALTRLFGVPIKAIMQQAGLKPRTNRQFIDPKLRNMKISAALIRHYESEEARDRCRQNMERNRAAVSKGHDKYLNTVRLKPSVIESIQTALSRGLSVSRTAKIAGVAHSTVARYRQQKTASS